MVLPHSYRSAILLICEASSSTVSPAVHDFFCRRQTMSSRRHRAHRPDRPSSAVTHFTLTLRQLAHALLCRTVFTRAALSSSPLSACPVVFCRFLGWCSDCSGEEPRSPCWWLIVCRISVRSIAHLSLSPLRKATTGSTDIVCGIEMRTWRCAWGPVFCRAAVPSPIMAVSECWQMRGRRVCPLDFRFSHRASGKAAMPSGGKV